MKNRKYYVKEVNKFNIIISYENNYEEQEIFNKDVVNFFSKLSTNLSEKLKYNDVLIILDVNYKESYNKNINYIKDIYESINKPYNENDNNISFYLINNKYNKNVVTVTSKLKTIKDSYISSGSPSYTFNEFLNVIKLEFLNNSIKKIDYKSSNKIEFKKNFSDNFEKFSENILKDYTKSILNFVYFFNDGTSEENINKFNDYIKDLVKDCDTKEYPLVKEFDDNYLIYNVTKDSIRDIINIIKNIMIIERSHELIEADYLFDVFYSKYKIFFIIDKEEFNKNILNLLSDLDKNILASMNVKCYNNIQDFIDDNVISITAVMDYYNRNIKLSVKFR